MKNFQRFMMASALAVCGVASAQAQGNYQIPNSDFEATPWNEASYNSHTHKEPGHGWNSFASAGGDMASWGLGSLGYDGNTDPVEGHNGGTAVQLTSVQASPFLPTANANGNLTTGRIMMGSTTATDLANHNKTDRTSADHSCLFVGLPDSVTCYAKYTRSGSDYNARGNFFIHGDVDYRDPADPANDQSAYLVASGEITITPATDWTLFKSAITYNKSLEEIGTDANLQTRYVLASFTTNPTPGATKGDVLIVDDVCFIYNSQLSALTYDGAPVEGFKADNYETLDMSSVAYDASKLAYTANGVGATVSASYNEETALLTLTVQGNDISVNAENQHVYTIQFAVPAPAVDVTPIVGEYDSNLDITVGGADASATRSYINLAAGEAAGTVDLTIKDFEFGGMQLGDITLTGVAVALGEDGIYTLSLDEPQTLMLDILGNGNKMPVDVTLNIAKVENGDLYASLFISALSGAINVTVEVSPYVEETPGVDVAAIVGDYKSKLVLELQGEPEPAVEGTVALAEGTVPETVDFTVKNFDILGMGSVDIIVTGVPVTMEEGVYTLEATGPQSSYQLYGTDGTVTLESATVTVSADKKELNALLSLEWNGMPMTLTITPAGEVSISDVADGSDRIYAADGQIIAVVGEAKAITVVDLAGRTVYAAEATEGMNVISGLAEGIYIVNGEKVLVK